MVFLSRDKILYEPWTARDARFFSTLFLLALLVVLPETDRRQRACCKLHAWIFPPGRCLTATLLQRPRLASLNPYFHRPPMPIQIPMFCPICLLHQAHDLHQDQGQGVGKWIHNQQQQDRCASF